MSPWDIARFQTLAFVERAHGEIRKADKGEALRLKQEWAAGLDEEEH